MTNKGFNDLLNLLQKLVPISNELPWNYYEAKQMNFPMGLEGQKIH
jgi:hypothetical protein